MHCNVNGDPQPVVQWTKDGAPLEQTTRTQFLSSKQILAIHELVTTDTGRYKCLAKNPAGNVTASVDITVYGKSNSDTFMGLLLTGCNPNELFPTTETLQVIKVLLYRSLQISNLKRTTINIFIA